MVDDLPLAALAGTWRGVGRGEYPTIAPFEYTEELVIARVPGRPLMHWRSTTRDAVSGEPRHAESGFLRSVAAGVELVVAHSFGIVEVSSGSFDGQVLALSTTAVVGTASAKRVDAVERRYELHVDRLRYSTGMAAVGTAMTHHLSAELQR